MSERPLKVRLVIDPANRGWILGKFAERLAANLSDFGVSAEVTATGSESADVNHWMNCFDIDAARYPNSTLYVAHVDRRPRLWALKKQLQTARMGICMSRMTVDTLVRCGLPRRKLCYVSPGHDCVVKPRRIVIGITSQVRPDGAKREHLLVALANRLGLDAFHFDILGKRWDKVIPHLLSAGATVDYFPGTDDASADYAVYVEHIPRFDYYLYTGLDEGSMGLLDALDAGVKTIVTPQGFHLDVEGGITHAFVNEADLCEIFATLAVERERRIKSVADWTWKEYASRHAAVWRGLLSGSDEELSNELTESIADGHSDSAVPLLSGSCFGANMRAVFEDAMLLLGLRAGRHIEQTGWYRGAASLYKRMKR